MIDIQLVGSGMQGVGKQGICWLVDGPIIDYNNKMSQSRLNKSESRTRSYLQQPIEFRKVMHNRNDHRSSLSPPERLPSQLRPTESRLERLINLDYSHSRTKGHGRHLSLSHSQAASRNKRTPHEILASPKNFSLAKNDSLAGLPSFQTPAPPSRVSPAQQKLSLKQQNSHSPSASLGVSIEELTDRMNQLVNRKLQLMFDSLHGRGGQLQQKKREVNWELQGLLDQMRQAEGLSGGGMQLLNQKIAFIETLMAEQNAEGEMMKKHYYHLSSSKIKGKVGDFTHQRAKVADAYQSLRHPPARTRQSLPKENLKKPLFKQTTNKSSYKQPHSSDYESYRYKHKLAPMNPQPMPRSSYKRDYLYLKSQPDEKIVNRDHSPYNPTSKVRVGSTYGQDYRRLKTETIDHRELDAFRDKIRTLKVSYMPQRRSQAVEDRTAYREAALSRVRSNNSQNRTTQKDLCYNKKSLLSESRRQYQGEVAFEPSRIKHQQLQSFQYKLKHLFKI